MPVPVDVARRILARRTFQSPEYPHPKQKFDHMLGSLDVTTCSEQDSQIIPFTEEQIKEEARMLVLGTPLSILDMQCMYPSHIQITGNTLRGSSVLTEKVDRRWHLITGDYFSLTMLNPKNYRTLAQEVRRRREFIPRACEVVYLELLLILARGLRLLEKVTIGREVFASTEALWVWTSSVVGRHRVVVGDHDENGMKVGLCLPKHASNNVGVMGSVPPS